jgi:hypothetical protein
MFLAAFNAVLPTSGLRPTRKRKLTALIHQHASLHQDLLATSTWNDRQMNRRIQLPSLPVSDQR